MASKLMNELNGDYIVSALSVFKFYKGDAYMIHSDIYLKYIFEHGGNISRNFFTIVSKVRNFLKRNLINYLICVDVSTALIGVLSALLTKTKVITWDHSSAYNKDLYSKAPLRFYGWVGLHCSKYYVTLTEDSRKKYMTDHRLPQNRLIVIPNWIEDDVCKSHEYNFDNHSIITVGRADTVKGYENLVMVAKIVLKRNSNWEWHIWGNFGTEYGKKILQLISNEDLKGRLIYKGISKSIYDVYSQYSLYVLTSYYEGLPMTILEAQMNNLPVVSFDCKTGPHEMIIDGVNGMLVECYDINMMADKIDYIINNKEDAERMSKNSKINMYKFRKEYVYQLWKGILC